MDLKLKPFDFASRLKAMDHWSTERAKKKEQSSSRTPGTFLKFGAWLSHQPAIVRR